MVLEAWYCCQAGMVWSWGGGGGAGYTRQGGTNMVQTISGCQGRRIAARGGDPKIRLLGASIYQLV